MRSACQVGRVTVPRDPQSVCAVVATFNRKELLAECLDALFAQTHPLDRIFVIDNASTDGTPELLRERRFLDRPELEHVRLEANRGGTGGGGPRGGGGPPGRRRRGVGYGAPAP